MLWKKNSVFSMAVQISPLPMWRRSTGITKLDYCGTESAVAL
jgi:hypothetical protein